MPGRSPQKLFPLRLKVDQKTPVHSAVPLSRASSTRSLTTSTREPVMADQDEEQASQPNLARLRDVEIIGTEMQNFDNIPAIRDADKIHAALDRINQRLDSMENKFDTNISDINNRLDNINPNIQNNNIRSQASSHNTLAFAMNTMVRHSDTALMAFKHHDTNEIPTEFPATARDISVQTNAQLNALLLAVNSTTNGTRAEKIGRFKEKIGLISA